MSSGPSESEHEMEQKPKRKRSRKTHRRKPPIPVTVHNEKVPTTPKGSDSDNSSICAHSDLSAVSEGSLVHDMSDAEVEKHMRNKAKHMRHYVNTGHVRSGRHQHISHSDYDCSDSSEDLGSDEDIGVTHHTHHPHAIRGRLQHPHHHHHHHGQDADTEPGNNYMARFKICFQFETVNFYLQLGCNG